MKIPQTNSNKFLEEKEKKKGKGKRVSNLDSSPRSIRTRCPVRVAFVLENFSICGVAPPAPPCKRKQAQTLHRNIEIEIEIDIDSAHLSSHPGCSFSPSQENSQQSILSISLLLNLVGPLSISNRVST